MAIVHLHQGGTIMFSTHFKNSIKALVVLAALLLAAYLYLKHRIHDVMVPPQLSLPKNDKETIVYNENRHEIGITTSSGTTWQYSRNPEVEVRKDGTIKVDTHMWGTELRPFLGIGYSDTGRVYVGIYLFYFRQFDAGASFGWTADNRKNAFQPMLSLSYNVWSNTSINIGMNPVPIVLQTKPEIAGFISVRL
jgi:hypothetical protein